MFKTAGIAATALPLAALANPSTPAAEAVDTANTPAVADCPIPPPVKIADESVITSAGPAV